MDRTTQSFPRFKSQRRFCVSVAGIGFGILAILQSGCLNYAIMLGYLIGGPPSIEPDFDRQTNKSMTDHGVTVAVVCSAPLEMEWTQQGKIDADICKMLSYKMSAHQIKTINPDRIIAWLDENPEWDVPTEIGEAFDATYVVYVDINEFSLFEKNSHELFRGHTEAFVSVYEMDESGEDGEKIYTREIIYTYPTLTPRAATEMTQPAFRKQYIERLTEQCGYSFYEHFAGDDIPDGT